MGLALFTVSAMAGLIYFLVHVALAKSTLFLVAGAIRQLTGSFELAKVGGLWVLKPGLAVLFGIAAMSLAGIPPFSGFLAKLALIEAGLEVDHVFIVLVALGVSLLTLYSMLKIWNGAFWKPLPTALEPFADGAAAVSPERVASTRLALMVVVPIVLLVACSLALVLAAGPAFELVDRAAMQLMDPAGYVEAVLGGGS
jgi:multicomponent Na+:H+ antiporter subunit D